MKNDVKNEVVEPQVRVGEKSRKPAIAVINRGIMWPFVHEILKSIEKLGYYENEEILVLGGEHEKCRNIKILDIFNNEIPNSERDQYYVIGEEKHRTMAVAKFNFLKQRNIEEQIIIPGVLMKLGEKETFAERITTINRTKRAWKSYDYVRSAANILDHPLMKLYNSMVKTDLNRTGIPISVLNMIYTSTKDSLSKRDFNDICEGKTVKGKDERNIIPEHNIDNGNLFIETCRKIGFEDHHINKRYIIQNFKELITKYGSHQKAIEVFSMMNQNDVDYIKKGRTLDEEKLKEKFEEIKSRA